MELDVTWWEKVNNPATFIADISAALREERSVCIEIGNNTLPWYETFLDHIRDEVHRLDSVRSFMCVEPPRGTDPGEFLMNRFCTEEEKSRYWPTKKISIFLAECTGTVMNRRYIYVKNIHGVDCAAWQKFVQEYSSSSPDVKALFLLECDKADSSSEHLTVIPYKNYVTDYDDLIMCLSITSPLKCKGYLKSYIADVAEKIGNGDIELAGYLAQTGDILAVSPEKTVRDILRNMSRTAIDPEQIKTAVWESQINLLFPLLERFRKQFANCKYYELKHFLPISNSLGEMVDNPNDLEIGTMYHIFGQHSNCISEDDFEWLKRCRNARNLLAHNDIVDFRELTELCDHLFNLNRNSDKT